jgi:acyl-CoA synthetase (AMP-forming)/AMP-acid ligase II
MVATFRERLAADPDRIALRGLRDGGWWELTLAEAVRTVRAAAAGLIELVAEGARVGIIAANRPEDLGDRYPAGARRARADLPDLTVPTPFARDAEVDLPSSTAADRCRRREIAPSTAR